MRPPAYVPEIGVFHAKTHLAELLRETEQGRSFVICRRGKPVACLIPPQPENSDPDYKTILASFKEIRKKITGPLNIRELIEEGRGF